ncbi:sialic acid TRAP transporter permease protein SiaT [Roseovarius sp. A-2]|uniref:TRAP transporter large permease n=1 Tax=Roseovarius sp. A-2 TaxID=1570360 RepID=UPI0009B5178A|nr:TRAP transporter large permease subunit [Roseovarius sp. A-2]GAW34174.1 sialic acid TRAP transporter permease protein SiaT [Roseovarius sp. A-2]
MSALVDALPLAMFAALAAGMFTGLPVAFVLGGVGVLFGGLAILLGEMPMIMFFNLVPRIWGGIAENLVLVSVPSFIFMGTMLERSGLAEDLLSALDRVLHRMPGGLLLSVTGLGTIFAATTGIVGASVVMMTTLALPSLLRAEVNGGLAAGTIASSATLGILIPPSIMLVVMADMMSVSVGRLFLGAVLPGLLLAGLYALYIFVTALLRPHMAPRRAPMIADDDTPLALLILRGLMPPVILILAVLGSIFGGIATPTEAAGVGALATLLLAALKGRASWAVIDDVCQRTARMVGMIFFIFIGATAFSLIFRILGGDEVIEGIIAALGVGPWGTLGLIMAVMFVLGFFLDWVEITLIILPVFTPIIVGLDFAPHVARGDVIFWFAILIAINLQTSFLTPPFGMSLFYLKAIAGRQIAMGTIFRGVLPFVLLQLVGLGLVMAFPEIALSLPDRMLN